MASRRNPDAVFLPADRSEARTAPRSREKIAKVVTNVRSRIDELAHKYEVLDDLLVGCLANDTGQADAISALGAEVEQARQDVDRMTRMVDALAKVVRSHHQQNKRRDAELEVIAQRQESILRQLARIDAPGGLTFEDSTTELDSVERAALFAAAGIKV